MVSAQVSLRESSATSILIAMLNSFARRPLCGPGRTVAPNLEPLTSSAEKLMSALWLIIVGMPQILTREKVLRNACHCTRRITALALAGSQMTTRHPLSTTTNTTGSIASQAWPSPTTKSRMSSLLGARRLIT